MRRFVTAMLTLALIIGLSSGKVSAQDTLGVAISEAGGFADLYSSLTVDRIIAIVAFAVTEAGIAVSLVRGSHRAGL